MLVAMSFIISLYLGGGYELEAHYPQWRRIHQSIERRQSFHDSLIKMIEGKIIHLFYSHSVQQKKTAI